MAKTLTKDRTVLAEKLVAAIGEDLVVVRKKKPKQAGPPASEVVSVKTDGPETLPPLKTLKGLKPGALITVEYPMAPGRKPGVYGAETVTVDASGKEASVKFLYQTKPSRSGALRVVEDKQGTRIIDAADERVVTVKHANRQQTTQLEQIRRAVHQGTLNAILKQGDVAAFVYGKRLKKSDEWNPGPVIGEVIEVDGPKIVVRYFYPKSIGFESQGWVVAPEVEMSFEDGNYTDVEYGCKLVMVRKPSPEEGAQFDRDRRDVLAHKAIPNMPKPKK